jgi:hypothetical protein
MVFCTCSCIKTARRRHVVGIRGAGAQAPVEIEYGYAADVVGGTKWQALASHGKKHANLGMHSFRPVFRAR